MEWLPLINYPRNSMDLQETAYFIPLFTASHKKNTMFDLSAKSGALSDLRQVQMVSVVSEGGTNILSFSELCGLVGFLLSNLMS